MGLNYFCSFVCIDRTKCIQGSGTEMSNFGVVSEFSWSRMTATSVWTNLPPVSPVWTLWKSIFWAIDQAPHRVCPARVHRESANRWSFWHHFADCDKTSLCFLLMQVKMWCFMWQKWSQNSRLGPRRAAEGTRALSRAKEGRKARRRRSRHWETVF